MTRPSHACSDRRLAKAHITTIYKSQFSPGFFGGGRMVCMDLCLCGGGSRSNDFTSATFARGLQALSWGTLCLGGGLSAWGARGGDEANRVHL